MVNGSYTTYFAAWKSLHNKLRKYIYMEVGDQACPAVDWLSKDTSCSLCGTLLPSGTHPWPGRTVWRS